MDRLTIDLRIRIDEVIQGRTVLLRTEHQVTAGRELDAILVVTPEEVVSLLWMFPCLARVDLNPPVAVQVELGPTVIAGDLSCSVSFRERFIRLSMPSVSPLNWVTQ